MLEPDPPSATPQAGEVIIRKFRVDAFLGTPLEMLLRLNRIRTIIHTGIATEVGVLPTAWHALNIGLFALVPEDCVGPMIREHHEDALRFLRRLAITTSSSDILEAWEKGPSGHAHGPDWPAQTQGGQR